MNATRKLVLHVGTHKTGTKTLQLFSAVNREEFFKYGVYVPRAGRVELADRTYTPGHHQLAWDAMYGHDPAALRALAEEIAQHPAPLTFVSSEDFEYSIAPRQPLTALREAFEAMGLHVYPLLYVRRQDSYAESIYAQFVRGGIVLRPGEFLKQIFEAGRFSPSGNTLYIDFDYRRLVESLADGFGNDTVVARPWRANVDPMWLPQDLLRVFSAVAGLDVSGNLQVPVPFANARDTLGTVLETARQTRGADRLPTARELVAAHFPERLPLLERRFTMLDRDESLALLGRFAESNAYLRTHAGCDVGFERPEQIAPADHSHWTDAAEQRELLEAVLAAYGHSRTG